MNGDRFFLDTNIFVYAFHPDERVKSARGLELVRRAGASGDGAISYQVVQEFFSVTLRKFRRPMLPADAEFYLSKVFRPLMAVESSLELFDEALHWHRRSQIPWYDALIVAAAQAANCAVLYSEDFQHGQRFEGLTVRNPFL